MLESRSGCRFEWLPRTGLHWQLGGLKPSMSKKHILKSIPNFQKSYALLSGEERVERAVVFVHGYGGGPTTTWREFHSLVDEYRETFEWWSASDLFFYSYESRWTPIGVNAQRLALFLHEILNSSSLRETNPANFLPQTGQSLPSFTWGSSTYRDLQIGRASCRERV